jgi:hypothetical protein
MRQRPTPEVPAVVRFFFILSTAFNTAYFYNADDTGAPFLSFVSSPACHRFCTTVQHTASGNALIQG